ncbi:hypothetical protein F4009_14855 [Candidatus Poribacteria bacterium]|nr:hypothetical protein [Candidatus Poribacteria bacterium]MYK95250.1 hypothetical protein [Candidatus Poribacteria bacterium]
MKTDPIVKHLGTFTLLLLILLVAGWIRVQGVPGIPEGQFISTDAYLYYWQAGIIAEHGTLPARDMHRWLPLGRDLGQTLNAYSYVTASAYKLIILFFPNVTLYQVHLFAPVVCFLIGMGVLCIFLYRTFGLNFAATVGLLLAIMPGGVERSAAGFSDRDSWCWLLGILTVIMYLWKEQAEQQRYRFGGTALSGFFMCLGGLSWEGFGVFGLVILAIELWRFLTSETEERLTEYLLWMFMFVPWLYLLSPAYRHGEGFATYLAVLVLFPPLVVLGMRVFRYFLTTHTSISQFIGERISARTLALVLCAGCLILSMSYAFSQQTSFTENTVPFSNNRLMQTVTELDSATDDYWYFRYGGVFLLGSLGLIGGCVRVWGKKGIILALMLCLIMLSTFFRVSLSHVLSPLVRLLAEHTENVGLLSYRLSFTVCEYLFRIAMALTGVAALGIACTRKEPIKNERVYIAMAIWLLLWVGLARDARRYDFFVGVPFAFFTAVLTHFVSGFIGEKYKMQAWLQSILKIGISTAVLTVLLLGELPNTTGADSLATRGVLTPTQMRGAIPGRNTPQGIAMENALNWMKTEYEEKGNIVVCTEWSYGSILNVLGGVKTVIDQDHFIQYWIHLYSRHVFCAQSEQEALAFLKTHEATHLMLTETEVLHPQKTSFVGSDENRDRQFKMIRMQARTPKGGSSKSRMVPAEENSAIKSIDVDFAKPVSITAKLKTGKNVHLPYVAVSEQRDVERNLCTENVNGGILHYFDEDTQSNTLYYIPPIGWNSLAVSLFFRGIKNPHFIPVYPEKEFPAAKVKVWKIHYPPDIKAQAKYRATAPKE